MRKSPRLTDYDYAATGSYFITACSKNMERRFGEVIAGELRLNDAGKMVSNVWTANAERYPGVAIDEYIVMPNHFHGIVHIGTDPTIDQLKHSLVEIVATFKSLSTGEYSVGVKNGDFPAFDRSLWQRSFYDRVLRDANDIERAREYIWANPARWWQRRNDHD
ncbi:transposase [soil metagenome]